MQGQDDDNQRTPTPSELRSMFGANLRQLARNAVSISALCRELQINRTQFNRYLAGESFPRPDVLHRICRFFKVDARILLEPVDSIQSEVMGPFGHPELKDFLSSGNEQLDEMTFPSGIYRFSRRSFVQADRFVVGIARIYRKDRTCIVRSFEAREAMRAQGMPTTGSEREMRCVVVPQEGGVAMLCSRRGSMTFSFNFLSPQSSFKNNYWVGYTARTAPESVTGTRATRLVFEKLDNNCGAVLEAARNAGFKTADELLPYHRTQLQIDTPFR